MPKKKKIVKAEEEEILEIPEAETSDVEPTEETVAAESAEDGEEKIKPEVESALNDIFETVGEVPDPQSFGKAKKPVRKPRRPIAAEIETPDMPEMESEEAALAKVDRSQQPVPFYKKIAITFVGLAVVLGIVVWIFSMKNATITITGKPQTVSFDATVALASEKTEGKTTGVVVEVPITATATLQPQTGVARDSNATVKVTIYNKTGSAQGLVKPTRFLTKEGILYRLTSDVTVPANGQITATIAADKIGKAFAVGPTSWTIPGLAPSKQTVIYGESKEASSSGEETVGIITDADLAAIPSVTETALKAAAVEAAKKKVTDATLTGFEVSLQDIVTSSSARVGQNTGSFAVSGKATARVVAYDPADVRLLAVAQVRDKYSRPYATLRLPDLPFKVTVARADASAKTADLAVHVEGVLELNPESVNFKADQFLGKSKSEVENLLKSLDGVESVVVKLSPRWLSKLPDRAEKVKVMVTVGL
ncbi:MAG: hypothetical protein HW383_630 [Candidatus Magasanikbacteria bacterium]|nr:hypothetical protein [Candidatus Magasanikbacteria bacterium]